MIAIGETCRNDLFAGFLLLFLGAFLIIWPEKIQKYQIGFQDRHAKLTALNPFADWNRSPAAALLIRFAGFIPIGIAFLAFFFASKNCSKCACCPALEGRLGNNGKPRTPEDVKRWCTPGTTYDLETNCRATLKR